MGILRNIIVIMTAVVKTQALRTEQSLDLQLYGPQNIVRTKICSNQTTVNPATNLGEPSSATRVSWGHD